MVWLLGVTRVDRVGRFWRVRAPAVNWQVHFMLFERAGTWRDEAKIECGNRAWAQLTPITWCTEFVY
jgi:hypothetical protein